MSSSFVDAKDTVKMDPQNPETVEMELFLTVMHDGGYGTQGQRIQRDLYRSGRSVDGQKVDESGISFEGMDNPNVSPSPNSMIENALIYHKMILVDMSIGSGYNDRIIRIRRRIKETARDYYARPDVSKLSVHLFVYFYAQGNPVSNIYADVKTDDEKEAIRQIRAVFSEPLFESSKVQYKGVEFFGSFDTDSVINFSDGSSVAIEHNTPTGDDVLDAAVLCQFTYDTQKVEDKSVISAIYDKFKSIFTSSENERVKTANNVVAYKDVKTKWQMLTSQEVADLTNNDNKFQLKSSGTGLYSQVFYKPAETGLDSGKFAYCTAGTNVSSPVDWFSNISQGLIDWAPQYIQSVRNAKILDKCLSSKILLFVGHSLGGGLASRNALATQSRHAVTFNAAGICFFRKATMWMIDRVGDIFHENKVNHTKRVHPFLIKGEILHCLLRFIGEMPYGFDKKQPSYVDDSAPMYTRVTHTVGRHAVVNFLDDAKVRQQLQAYNPQV